MWPKRSGAEKRRCRGRLTPSESNRQVIKATAAPKSKAKARAANQECYAAESQEPEGYLKEQPKEGPAEGMQTMEGMEPVEKEAQENLAYEVAKATLEHNVSLQQLVEVAEGEATAAAWQTLPEDPGQIFGSEDPEI